MEKKELSKFSSYTRICQKFALACEEEGLEPGDCLLAIARLLDLPTQATTLPASSLAPMPAGKIQLTKEQAEEARKVAKEAKAKKLGLSPKEVNLTPQEAKDAKAQYRKRLVSGATAPKTGPTAGGNDSTKKNKKVPSLVTTVTGEDLSETFPAKLDEGVSPRPLSSDSKKKVGVQQDKSGSRATAKTKIDNLRRLTLRSLPTALDLPSALHLVAYANHRSRLSRQWEEYRRTYESTGMLDPLRGLPDPWLLYKTRKFLALVTKDLREQNDSPGTYILQSEDGGSFWDRDKPSLACPSYLKDLMPEEVIKEMEECH